MKEKKLLLYSNLFIGFLLLLLINQTAHLITYRIDLTEDKKYTISPSTKALLQKIKTPVFFELYLDGDMPPKFKRFQKSIAVMLGLFKEESNNKVQFKFIDPNQATSTKSRTRFHQSLMERGIKPSDLTYIKNGAKQQKTVFPGGIVSMGMHEIPINLLKGNRMARSEEILNQSIEGIEYELISAISHILNGQRKNIAYIRGHNEPPEDELLGFKSIVTQKYNLQEVYLPNIKELKGYDAVVIGKPKTAFSENEKYVLDQYLMHGGNLLFFIDALKVRMDSVSGDGTVAIPYQLNLTDLLFKYGVRINNNYVVDINCGQYPVITGNYGNQPQMQLIPWPYFPLISNFSDHYSVKNLDAILTKFTSTIDTVKATGVTKTPLAFTSPYTIVLSPPIKVSFNDLRDELSPEKFDDGTKVVSYLLEGSFTSLYKNRLIPYGFDKKDFLAEGKNGKIIVFSDGDIIRNEIDPLNKKPLGLGVEILSKASYANEEFIKNVLSYLTDDHGIMASRSRIINIRPLDKVKIRKEKVKWQFINLVIPIVLILFVGIVKWSLRKRKYSS